MTTKERYIDPFTDFGFKKLFGEEPNKDLLIDFLNELLKQQDGGTTQIKSLTYANSERLGNTNEERKAIFDLYCENENGERFIIELQKARQQFFKDRSLYYATFAIREQAQKGQQWNFHLQHVYTVSIMDFVFDNVRTDRFQHTVKLVETDTQEIFYDKLTFIYLEMPKFRKTEDELTTHFDKWLYLLQNLRRFDEIPAILQERIFRKAFRIAEVSNLNEEEMNAYEADLKYRRDWKNAMDFAVQEAAAEATAAAAVKAAAQRVSIAQSLKSAGVDVAIIAQSTGLTLDEVNAL